MTEMKYSPAELMIINAARLLRDGDTVFVGVGQPNLACNLAKRTHAPNLVMIYEAGVIGAQPARLPLSIGDPTLVSGALSVVSMYDIFSLYLQRGNVDVGFMGGAQIDKYGNINATVIGNDYAHPKNSTARIRRLPGDRRMGKSLLPDDPASEAALSRKSGLHHLRRFSVWTQATRRNRRAGRRDNRRCN